MVFVDVVNPTDEPIDVTAVMNYEAAPNAKFGRRLWVPARARRLAWAPILAPAEFPPEEEVVEITTVLEDASKPNNPVFKAPTNENFYTSLVPLDRDSATGLISDTGVVPEAERDFAHETIEALRLSAGYDRILHLLQDDFLPPTPEGLDALDHLLISSDRLGDDSAALAAVRRWLYGGGRLWIMLDRVSPATAVKLLGDDFPCAVVDRVGLTSVRMAAVGEPSGDVKDSLREPRDYEEPVDFVRVAVDDADVKFTVDDWPAAFWLRAGRGVVLVTTLGARGWIRPRTDDDGSSRNAMLTSEYIALPALKDLGSDWFANPTPPPLTAKDFEPALDEEIGYRIPGKGMVTAVLALFCSGLFVGGVLLGRAGRREHLGWAGPVAALAAGGVLAFLGLQTRQRAPTQVASGQLVEVAAGVQDIHVSGALGLYHQSPSDQPVGADAGGVFTPDTTGLGNVPRRIIYTEVDKWRYDDLTLPAGVRFAPFSYAGRLEASPEARARFGPEGLTGTAKLEALSDPDDALAAFAPTTAPLAIELSSDGRFVSGDTLAPGEFLTGGLLTDRQRRRQELYRKMLAGADSGFPSEPTLLVWARPLDLKFAFDPEARTAGDALVSIPLAIERTPPGEKVLIPAACLPFRTVAGPDDESISSVYSFRKGEWLDSKLSTKCWLRFQVPRQVTPLHVDRAVLRVNIRAPSRTVEFRAVKNGDSAPIGSRTSPGGEQEIALAITDPELLKLDEAGGLRLGLWIGELEGDAARVTEESEQLTWQVEHLSLELSGVTAP
jgi:hypothetical protein